MANHVLLNNVEHRDLKVTSQFSDEMGDNMMCVPAYPVELRHAQAAYPLLFTKDNAGNTQLVALLGFEQGENLFVKEGKWQASYRPLLVEKGPFLIGRNEQDGKPTLSIHIDLDSPKVSKDEGQPIFLPHGGNTDYIDNMANILSTIHQSQQEVAAYLSMLQELDLIESFVVDIELGDEGTHRLAGFSTLNEEKIKALSAAQLGMLHEKGYLELIYMQLASMSQLSRLVDLRKAK